MVFSSSANLDKIPCLMLNHVVFSFTTCTQMRLAKLNNSKFINQQVILIVTMSFHLIQVLMVWLTIQIMSTIRSKREFSLGEPNLAAKVLAHKQLAR